MNPAGRAMGSSLGDSDVVAHLVSAGVISMGHVVDVGLSVESNARRNRNFRVEWPDGSGYFVKTPDAYAPMSRTTLLAEAEFHRTYSGRGHPFSSVLTELVHVDPELPVLVFALLHRHRSLRDICLAAGMTDFPISVFRVIGRLLGELHLAGSTAASDGEGRRFGSAADFSRPDPWVINGATQGTLFVLEIIQGSVPTEKGLAGLAGMWRPEGLVHGDMRADNIMVADAGGARDVRLTDWEMWHVGDPAWDVAGLLEAAVSLTVARPVGSDRPHEMAEGLAPDTTTATLVMQSTCRALWSAYVRERGLSRDGRRDLAPRVAAYCAARMIQSAIEIAGSTDGISESGMMLLQIAENVFAEPERAAAEFFALL